MDHNKDSQRWRTWKLILAALLCCIVAILFSGVFCVLIHLASSAVLPIFQIDVHLLDISYNELLVFFGVAAGICYSVWAYKEDRREEEKKRSEERQEKERLEEQEWEEYKPDFQLSLCPLDDCFELSIENIGIKSYYNIRYCCDGKVADLLPSGETVKVIICKLDYWNTNKPERLGSVREIVDQDWYDDLEFPSGFFISAFDQRDQYWIIHCDIKDGVVANCLITNG